MNRVRSRRWCDAAVGTMQGPFGKLALLAFLPACTGQIRDPAWAPPGAAIPTSPGPTAGAPSADGGAPAMTPVDPRPPGPEPTCAAGAVGPARWRRLTTRQYRNSVRDLLGLEADTAAFLLDTTTGPFATNALLPPQSSDIEHYQGTAATLAARAVADLPRLLGCDPGAAGQDGCATRFIEAFAARAYRRPLEAAEKEALAAVYTAGKEESFTAGVRLVVEAVLQSPSFLYLAEFGTGTGAARPLSGHEISSRLSYLLWNTMPDAALFAAAAAGTLDRPEGVRAEANRLLSSPRFDEAVSSFHTQLFGTTRLVQEGVVSRNPARYPEFDPALRAAMIDETNRFVSYLFSRGDGTISTLLSATFSFPSGPLARLYGAPPPGPDGRVDFTDGSRHGILTQASFLATQPPIETAFQAVLRGKSVRFDLLCQTIAPPPMGVDFSLPPGAEKMTQQQLLRAHQVNPSCRPCHQLMDSVGFGLENYDAIGRHRTRAADGSTIDASGELIGTDVDGPFANAAELTAKLARSQDVRRCLANQWFRFALGREPTDADRCSMAALEEAFAVGGGDVRRALGALVGSDAFRYRRGE
jgi:hypothetical protein